MKRYLPLVAVALLAMVAGDARASLQFDQNITAIFGSGNADTNWTLGEDNGVSLGLRAKVRYNASGLPENTFNSNGDGTYSHAAGEYNSNGLARWNFEFSINSGNASLNELTYLLEIDQDAGWGEDFSTLFFDPINLPFADHSLGDGNTANGQGTEAGDATTYQALIGTSSVAQNSWNRAFSFLGPGFDPNLDGRYGYRLTAFDANGGQLAQTRMTVIVGDGAVPEPGSLIVWSLLGLAGISGVRRRR